MNTAVSVPNKMRENKLKYLSEHATIIKVTVHRTMKNGMLMTHIQFKDPSDELFKYLKAYAPVMGIEIFQDTMFLNQQQYDFILSHVK